MCWFVGESLGSECVGRVGTIKDLNPPFPVLKAGHSVSYSCVCDVDRDEVGFFLFFLNFPVWLVCYAHVFHAVHILISINYNQQQFQVCLLKEVSEN